MTMTTIDMMTMPPPLPLPQPTLPIRSDGDDDDSKVPPHRHYQYVPFDIFETDWLGDPRRLPLLPLVPTTSLSSQTQTAALVADVASRSNNADGTNQNQLPIARYSPGTLVWVMLSKGKPKCPNNTIAATNVASSGCADALAIHKKRRDKKNKRRITSSTNSNTTMMNESISHQSSEEESTTIVSGQLQQEQREEEDSSINESTSSTQTLTVNHHSRKEFFLRARVVADDEEIISQKTSSSSSSSSAASSVVGSQWNRRILVRYSRGATYRVHAYNLIPVLEPSVHHKVVSSFSEVPAKTTSTTTKSPYIYPPLVVLVPETNIYRRVAKVHTTSEDTFMEIGCDYGITVDKIRHSIEEAGNVPRVWAKDGEIIGEDNKYCTAGTTLHEEMDKIQHRISCLGVDKSVESIKIANERCDAKQIWLIVGFLSVLFLILLQSTLLKSHNITKQISQMQIHPWRHITS